MSVPRPRTDPVIPASTYHRILAFQRLRLYIHFDVCVTDGKPQTQTKISWTPGRQLRARTGLFSAGFSQCPHPAPFRKVDFRKLSSHPATHRVPDTSHHPASDPALKYGHQPTGRNGPSCMYRPACMASAVRRAFKGHSMPLTDFCPQRLGHLGVRRANRRAPARRSEFESRGDSTASERPHAKRNRTLPAGTKTWCSASTPIPSNSSITAMPSDQSESRKSARSRCCLCGAMPTFRRP